MVKKERMELFKEQAFEINKILLAVRVYWVLFSSAADLRDFIGKDI